MGALIVTEENIEKISIKTLVHHYKKIEKQINIQKSGKLIMHPSVYEELLREKEIISGYLKKHKKEDLLQEQMVIPGLIPEKEHYEVLVENHLREYYFKKIRLEALIKRLEQGFEIVFPANISKAYGKMVMSGGGGYSEYLSSSERAVIQKEVDRQEAIRTEIWDLKDMMNPIEMALEQLDELEREFVEKKYFQRREPTNLQLIAEMPVEKTKFYSIKQSALSKLAEALHLI